MKHFFDSFPARRGHTTRRSEQIEVVGQFDRVDTKGILILFIVLKVRFRPWHSVASLLAVLAHGAHRARHAATGGGG